LKTRSAVCTAPRRDDGHRHRRSSERETTAANGDGEGGADPSLGDSSLVENVRFGDEELFVFDDFVRSLSAGKLYARVALRVATALAMR